MCASQVWAVCGKNCGRHLLSSMKIVGATSFRGLWAFKWAVLRFVGVKVGVPIFFWVNR